MITLQLERKCSVLLLQGLVNKLNKQRLCFFTTSPHLSQQQQQQNGKQTVLSSLIETSNEPNQVSTHVTGVKRGFFFS
jgi:hypothetical protein